MGKIAFFDCNAGVSGNMFVGALLDLGLPAELLMNQLEKLLIDLPPIDIGKTNKMGISATLFNVHEQHEHHHRHLADIIRIIEESGLSEKVKNTAVACFRNLAIAEAKVHGVGLEEIHFHEVGAVDAIVDIVCACVGMDWLAADAVMVSPIRVGYGTIRCAHGNIPLPAPAALELLEGFRLFGGELEGEWTTPTGAAILKTFVTNVQISTLPLMQIEEIGYGSGTADRLIPNVFRILLGTAVDADQSEKMMVIETNIDDMNPELYGYLGEQLLAAGARDFHYTPVYMKKNRPGTLVSVLTPPENAARVEQILFQETTTLGVRKYSVERKLLQRSQRVINVQGCPIRIKTAFGPGIDLKLAPEYEDCKAAATQLSRSLREIYELVMITAKKTDEDERKLGRNME